jgi:flagellar operon protein
MRVEQFGGINPTGGSQQAQRPANRPGDAAFGSALVAANDRLTLSRHAQHRVDRRGLELGADQMERIEGAVRSAEQKGARNSVVMIDDLAVVVDIQQRMVVTAMEREGSRDRVFTNIDSVVIA